MLSALLVMPYALHVHAAEPAPLALGLGTMPDQPHLQKGWFQQRETIRQAILLELEARGYTTIDGVFETITDNATFINPECAINHPKSEVTVSLIDMTGEKISSGSWTFNRHWPDFVRHTHAARLAALGALLDEAGFPTRHSPQRQSNQNRIREEKNNTTPHLVDEEAWWREPTLPRILTDIEQLNQHPQANRDARWYQQASRRWADLGRIAEMAYGSLHQVCKARSVLLALQSAHKIVTSEAQETLAFALTMSGYQKAARDLIADLPPPTDSGSWQEATRVLAYWDFESAEKNTTLHAIRRARWLLISSWLARWNDMNTGWRRTMHKALIDCSPHPTYALGDRSGNHLGDHQHFVNTVRKNWRSVPAAPALPEATGAESFLSLLTKWPQASGKNWAFAQRILEDYSLQIAFAQVRKNETLLQSPQDLNHLLPMVSGTASARYLSSTALTLATSQIGLATYCGKSAQN